MKDVTVSVMIDLILYNEFMQYLKDIWVEIYSGLSHLFCFEKQSRGEALF